MPVTLREVASKAGVSPVVVSRVLHNKAQSIRVSEATAERVRQAAVDLGYRVNIAARNFRAQQTMSLGVLHGTGTTRPKLDQGSRYFASLMDGIIEGAFNNGYSVTLCPKLLGSSPEDAISDGRFDGLVWYSSVATDENLELIGRTTVPIVLLHAHSSKFGYRHPSVLCDNTQGIGLAVDHLVALGHERIAFAMEVHPTIVESLERLDAFRHHMHRHKLKFDESDLLEVDWAHKAVREYFESGMRHTAILAENEGLASEYLLTAQEFSIDIPEDLSIVGFDSTTFCEEFKPSLTSVSQPLSLMGSRAIELLVDRIEGREAKSLEIVFPCGLDVRGSTGPARRGEII